MYDELLEALGVTDWEGDDCSLVCPCGNVIEPDGQPPCGCENPLRALGAI